MLFTLFVIVDCQPGGKCFEPSAYSLRRVVKRKSSLPLIKRIVPLKLTGDFHMSRDRMVVDVKPLSDLWTN